MIGSRLPEPASGPDFRRLLNALHEAFADAGRWHAFLYVFTGVSSGEPEGAA